MAGRPTKLTPERQQKLVQAIAAGNYYETACRYAGIDYSNFRHWLEKGEQQASGIYHDFREAITRAETEAEMRAVVAWQRAFPDDWRAAKEFLEHRHRETWGKPAPQDHNVTQNVSGQVGVQHGVHIDGANALLAALGFGPVGSTDPGDASAGDSGDPAATAD